MRKPAVVLAKPARQGIAFQALGHTLAAYFTRYIQDRDSVAKSLTGPVLVYQPAQGPVETTDKRFRLQTASGVGRPIWSSGEPRVFLVHKYKDNAFPRGVTVGRTSNNDLVVDHPSVSRFHAWFQRESARGPWRVADANSKNGTFLDGEKLVAKKMHRLGRKTTLHFGQVEMTFLSPEEFLQMLRGLAQEVR